MGRLILSSVVAVVLSVGFSTAADGEKGEKVKKVNAKVVSVDADKMTLTASVPGGEGEPAQKVEFALTGVKITSGKAEVKLADLKAGDTVTIITDVTGKIVKSVSVAGKKGDGK